MSYDDNGSSFIGSKRKRNVHGNAAASSSASKRGRVSEKSTDESTGFDVNADFESSSDQSYSRRGSIDYTVRIYQSTTQPFHPPFVTHPINVPY